jgi:hypothetical protein
MKVEQRLNATVYLNIIANQVHLFYGSSVSICNKKKIQQDNAPYYKARIVKEWFHEHDNVFSLLQWPAQTPDLNPIEYMWDEMEQVIWSRDVTPAPAPLPWCSMAPGSTELRSPATIIMYICLSPVTSISDYWTHLDSITSVITSPISVLFPASALFVVCRCLPVC